MAFLLYVLKCEFIRVIVVFNFTKGFEKNTTRHFADKVPIFSIPQYQNFQQETLKIASNVIFPSELLRFLG